MHIFFKTVHSYSKINYFLNVYKNKKVYKKHQLKSVAIINKNLYDIIHFQKTNDYKISIEVLNYKINLEDNFVYNAINKLIPFTKNFTGVHIKIIKNIPVGSGLGGGSSNLAYCVKLYLMSHVLKVKKSFVKNLLYSISSDSLIFYYAHKEICLIKRKGKRVNATKYSAINMKIEILTNNLFSSTKKVYEKFDQLKNNYYQINKKFFTPKNNLQKSAFLTCKGLKEEYRSLKKEYNKFEIHLTGSGSSFFILNND